MAIKIFSALVVTAISFNCVRFFMRSGLKDLIPKEYETHVAVVVFVATLVLGISAGIQLAQLLSP